MRKLIATLTVVSLLAGIAAIAAFGATTSVTWKNPTSKTVKIRKGGTVKWVWTGDSLHNVKGTGFKSSFSATKGHTYSHTFRSRGTFKIICQTHPTTMKTVVKVS
jgi:plastocyanin